MKKWLLFLLIINSTYCDIHDDFRLWLSKNIHKLDVCTATDLYNMIPENEDNNALLHRLAEHVVYLREKNLDTVEYRWIRRILTFQR